MKITRERKLELNWQFKIFPVFNALYEKFKNNKLPSRAVLIGAIRDLKYKAIVEEAVDTFIVNSKYVGLLQTLSGAERFISIDHLLDSMQVLPYQQINSNIVDVENRNLITQEDADLQKHASI